MRGRLRGDRGLRRKRCWERVEWQGRGGVGGGGGETIASTAMRCGVNAIVADEGALGARIAIHVAAGKLIERVGGASLVFDLVSQSIPAVARLSVKSKDL